MKKSTLILVLMALALGGFVYYYEFKRPPAAEKSEETSKSVFSFTVDDVAALTLVRGGQTIAFEKHGSDWVVTQPVETRADQSVLGGIASGLATARISRTIAAAPDRLVTYGLVTPAVTLEIKLKNGQQHRLRLGAKDFSALNVYGIVDDAKDVALLPDSLLTSADKSLDDLRDRSVLDLSSWDMAGFDLKNKSGEIAAKKESSGWQIEKPRATGADSSAMDSLLAQVTSAKMTGIVSEAATGLPKYGLDHPEITFRARSVKGEERALEIGKKEGDDYYARDSARPMIFRVSANLYKKLGATLFDLRDKSIVHLDREKLAKAEIRNQNGRFVCELSADDKWKIAQPTEQKGKEAQGWKFIDPIDNARAQEIQDAPSASIAARLAKPAIEVILTDKSGKTTKISISGESAGSVYVRTNAGSTVYKLGKQFSDDLNFKPADLAQ